MGRAVAGGPLTSGYEASALATAGLPGEESRARQPASGRVVAGAPCLLLR